MKRRSFFKSFMGLVATVALAPELAFGQKLSWEITEAEIPHHTHGINAAWETAPYEVWFCFSANLLADKEDRTNRMLTLSDMDKGPSLC